MKKLTRENSLLLIGISLVVIDQVIKILVKTNMYLGQTFNVIGNWFKISFIENEGMAFGMKFGGVFGKFLLSSFRVCLFVFLVWWISRLARHPRKTAKIRTIADVQAEYKAEGKPISRKLASGKVVGLEDLRPVPYGVLVGLTVITAGALGNILDCLFYGMIFSESSPDFVATFGSYAPFMFGKVVDMLYFPIINTTWPDWIPGVGGTHLEFFRPIFNFADCCVTVGAAYLIFFQYKFFTKDDSPKKKKEKKEKKPKPKKKPREFPSFE